MASRAKRSPNIVCPRPSAVKASPTALLSLGWQFDLIEIKAARSGLVLFFLYLPLSLIFLKDEFDGWACATIYSF